MSRRFGQKKSRAKPTRPKKVATVKYKGNLKKREEGRAYSDFKQKRKGL